MSTKHSSRAAAPPALDCDRITATIPEFIRLSGISRSTVYELLRSGQLRSVHLGARRLILVESYRRLLARLQEEQRGKWPHPPVEDKG